MQKLTGSLATNLGFSRMGAQRQLKKALECFWSGACDADSLLEQAARIKSSHWKMTQEAGIDHIPSNDFSLYDHVLDTAMMVGAIPHDYAAGALQANLTTYFSMARGRQVPEMGINLPPLAMKKWFDTNYHYIVPQITAATRFNLLSNKPLAEYREARAEGLNTRPVLLGPVSFLLLAQVRGLSARWSCLDALLPVYEEVLASLSQAGAEWAQIDEPCLVLDMDEASRAALRAAYDKLATAGPQVLLATYFGDVDDNLPLALSLPVAALHLDMTRGAGALRKALQGAGAETVFSLGVVDGRNVWRTDLHKALTTLRQAADEVGPHRIMVAPSCSLLHVPEDASSECRLPPDIRSLLAFGKQKLQEVRALASALQGQSLPAEVEELFEISAKAQQVRKSSERVNLADVQKRVAALNPSMQKRCSEYPVRRRVQNQALKLPLLPTTTIGSFPQTKAVRAARKNLREGVWTTARYDDFLREETTQTIRMQEKLGLDVLVHGEFERNDMVEYFGEQLTGFATTEHGWVQSYGSRCVKPPIIYGDVSRRRAMTVEWTSYAQALTTRPLKGMLTGPVTILQWSFVRDDQPRSVTCQQISLAVRDEVVDLEKAGIKLIQIDEPAIREGLPLRKAWAQAYLKWAVGCFQVASSGVADTTQIHTHMCYSEFNDIIDSVAAMDADVVSIESSRSRMELLGAFERFAYPNGIGPGVYDIHSPRIPDVEEIADLLRTALRAVPAKLLWTNPDCGLKTRSWPEVEASLANMVAAARLVRAEIHASGGVDAL